MSMTFDFSDLFGEMRKIEKFNMKDIEQEIVRVATAEMQEAIRQVYAQNAPNLKGRAQKFVIPLPNLQNAVVSKCENDVVESYIDEEKLDHGSCVNEKIFTDINGDLIAKLWFSRRQHLRMTKKEKEIAKGKRNHPEEYYVRNMDEYWQMPIGSISELEFIEDAWTFRLEAMKAYYFGVIKEYKERLERLTEFKKMALAVEGKTDLKKTIKNSSTKEKLQKELQKDLEYFVKFQNGKYKFDEKER